jgi:asparagine synthase (glutamine-hydrolysing)
VAHHLGTDHAEMYVTPAQALQVIPDLPNCYSEPFADSTQIPNILLSRLAREQVTVALSGDAGDELFCGYDRYQLARQRWSRLSRLPGAARGVLASGLAMLSHAAASSAVVGRFSPETLRRRAAILASRTVDELYGVDVSHVHDPATWVIGGSEPPTYVRGKAPDLHPLQDMERMMATDTLSYLPDDILAKVDRAAMSVSLETRVPLLDHRLVEFAWTLPLNVKVRDGRSKWVLREILYRHVPRELIDRPKKGFSVPICEWLRGPLRDWAEALLDASRLRQDGYLREAPIRRLWTEHLSGACDWSARLWNILMFQAWLRARHE